MNDLKIGMVGIGQHCRSALVPAFFAQRAVMLTSFCDVSSEAREWATKRFPTAAIVRDIRDDSFWSQLDLICCCATPTVHEASVTLAMSRGINCFCEKPLATSYAAVEHLSRPVNPAPAIGRVGHNFRYTSGGKEFIRVLNEIDDKVAVLQLTYLGGPPRGSRWDLPRRHSFSLTHLTHAIDFVTATVGEVLSVEDSRWSSLDDTDSVAITLTTARCASVTVHATNAARAFSFHATAVLASGTIIRLNDLRRLTIIGGNAHSKRAGLICEERPLGTTIENDGYIGELEAVINEIRGVGICNLPDFASAAKVLQVIEYVENSRALPWRVG